MHLILLTFTDTSAERLFQKEHKQLQSKVEIFITVCLLCFLIFTLSQEQGISFSLLTRNSKLFAVYLVLLFITLLRYLLIYCEVEISLRWLIPLHGLWLWIWLALILQSSSSREQVFVESGLWISITCVVSPFLARNYVLSQFLLSTVILIFRPMAFTEIDPMTRSLAEIWEQSSSWTNLWLDGQVQSIPSLLTTTQKAQRMRLALNFMLGFALPSILNWTLEAYRRMEFAKKYSHKYPYLRDINQNIIHIPYTVISSLVTACVVWKFISGF